MVKERKILELMEEVADWYYEKTGDKWYFNLAETIRKKRGETKWWRK